MDIFVTGGNGFLGKTLCTRLRVQGHRVQCFSSKECNLFDPASLHQFDREHYDHIYHLAAWTQAGDFSRRFPGDQWICNQKINIHLLDWWQKRQPQAKLITIGTSSAYDPSFFMSEENYFAGSPMQSFFAYAMAKRTLLSGLEALHKQYGLNYLYVIPSTIFGVEGYHTDGRQLHFIFDLIRKILRGKLYNERVILWGDGEQRRELVHIDDFLNALLYLSETAKNEIFNIGEGKEHSIRDFVRMICEEVQFDISQIEYDPNGFVGARSKILSIEKLKQTYRDYSPRPPIEGIREIIRWLSQHPHFL